MAISLDSLLDSADATIWEVVTKGPGPAGSLPLDEEMLLNAPSGDLFGLTQNAGMGWDPSQLLRKQFLILSTQGGIRGEDGKPIALGYHTGHYEVGLLMRAAAEELNRLEAIPFAAYVSDPCDGRTQGTVGMMDSLAFRHWGRHLRQGTSRDDAGADGPTESSLYHRAGGCHTSPRSQ